MGALIVATLLSGCGLVASSQPNPALPGSAPAVSRPTPATVPSARVGKPGRSERVHFVPEMLVLPGNARAGVVPAATVDGELKVPEDVAEVGWWDGSAYAGEPFGSTVIAGHVDSTSGGNGFFARLRRVRIGDVVTLRAGPRELS